MSTQETKPQSDSRDAPVDDSTKTPANTDSEYDDTMRDSSEEQRPPLPPRPNTLSLLDDEAVPRATLQAEATTAVSRAEVDTEPADAGSSAYSTLVARGLSRGLKARASLSQVASPKGSDAGDSASIRSSVQNGDAADAEALFPAFVTAAAEHHPDAASLLHFPEFAAEDVDDDVFLGEFEPVGELDENAGNEGEYSFEIMKSAFVS